MNVNKIEMTKIQACLITNRNAISGSAENLGTDFKNTLTQV